jgi:alkylation response protein AidB-like acyl-CoA dehydrogenase
VALMARDAAAARSELAREVTDWLEEHWDPALPVEDWWRLVARAGWTAPHLPVGPVGTVGQGGRGLPRSADRRVRALFAEHGALRPPGGLGLLMAAPTILRHGTPEQIERHVPPILEGRLAWCQLFSEPGAGSDLAGLTTRAVRDGDRWVITGQKVWSSMAREADYGMLLARTNPDVPKHAGISWFAFPLDQPGVTIRPLREMTGEVMFNEVFLDGAVCEHADLIGGENEGWAVTQSTLFFERTGIGAGGSMADFPKPGPKGGMLGRLAGDAAQERPPRNDKVLAFEELVALAQRTGGASDPLVRQKLARLWTFLQVGTWNALRARAEAKAGGGGAVASIGKLAQTRIMKLSAEIALDLLGPAGMLEGDDGVAGGRFVKAFVFAPASSIYGGTDEIQRNIAAERTLGLPREPSPDKGLSFAEATRRQAARRQSQGSEGS